MGIPWDERLCQIILLAVLDVMVVSVQWIRNISIIREMCHIWTPLQKQDWPLETPDVLSTKIKIGYAQI